MAKYTASEIAKWFLYYNKVQYDIADSDPITNLKLQKLLYYAQGCYLAIYDKPLFDDPIEAWQHGPVIPSVYHEYKRYGGQGIEFTGYDGKIDQDTESFLIDVYNTWGQYSAWGLRNMTHQEDPWKNTPEDSVIPQDAIKKYFLEHYVEEN